MNVEIGTKATKFLVWEYLFQIFGIVSLQWISVISNIFLCSKILLYTSTKNSVVRWDSRRWTVV